jgi:uncharacterized membrane protein
MNTEKIVKEAKIIMITGIIVGVLLLVIGLVFSLMEVDFISNKKAIIGLSFIPFCMSFIYYLKLRGIKKSPQKMKNIIINENDERLVALKNEADAKAFKIIQVALFFCYMGYTLMVPEDVFEAVGWWVLTSLLFLAFISQGILAAKALKDPSTEE